MIEIVFMQPEHVDQIAHLEQLSFSDPWSENSIASELTNPLSLWLSAMAGAELVGYIGSQSVLGESDMMNVAVAPAYRRRGIARKLVETLVTELSKCGNHCLTLEVRASNAPAIALYQSLGFAEIGRRRGYYRNPKEDALIMRKEWEV